MNKARAILGLSMALGGVTLVGSESYSMVKGNVGKTFSRYNVEYKSLKSNLTPIKSSENLGDFEKLLNYLHIPLKLVRELIKIMLLIMANHIWCLET